MAVPKEKKPGRRERWKQELWKVCVFRVGRMDVLNPPPAYIYIYIYMYVRGLI